MDAAHGITIRSGPWSVEQVVDHLRRTAIPIRLATQGTDPLVQSLWFLFDDGALWCATQADSVVARRIRANPRCAFEVSADTPPYRGVRGTGRAELLPDRAADVLPRLIDRYVGDGPSSLADWLVSRIDSEVAVRITELAVTSWDYSERMASGA
jgi:nitroimidazol reductase NimA-like FMN-containing flavoprotein (pyridoxamine 5'-phosphate oxidase superfamily)